MLLNFVVSRKERKNNKTKGKENKTNQSKQKSKETPHQQQNKQTNQPKKTPKNTGILFMELFPTSLTNISSVVVSIVPAEAPKLSSGPSSPLFMLLSSKHAVPCITVKVPVAA